MQGVTIPKAREARGSFPSSSATLVTRRSHAKVCGRNAVAGWLVQWIQAFLRWRRVAEMLAEAPETQAEAEEIRREIAPFERVVAKAAADLSHEIRTQS